MATTNTPPPAAPSGWKLVPETPTRDMIDAGQWPAEDDGALACWKAMLAAAPTPPDAAQERGEKEDGR